MREEGDEEAGGWAEKGNVGEVTEDALGGAGGALRPERFDVFV